MGVIYDWMQIFWYCSQPILVNYEHYINWHYYIICAMYIVWVGYTSQTHNRLFHFPYSRNVFNTESHHTRVVPRRPVYLSGRFSCVGGSTHRWTTTSASCRRAHTAKWLHVFIWSTRPSSPTCAMHTYTRSGALLNKTGRTPNGSWFIRWISQIARACAST